MVRSQFEHCSTVWSPSSNVAIDKLESVQKRAIKWILGEEYCSYSPAMYYLRCRELNLLPLRSKLILKDLKLFSDIIYNRVPINLPEYLHFYSGCTRLRSSHLDNFSIVSDVHPRVTCNYSGTDIVSTSLTQFSNSYFYRTMTNWNCLPYDTRKVAAGKEFESGVAEWLWGAARPPPEWVAKFVCHIVFESWETMSCILYVLYICTHLHYHFPVHSFQMSHTGPLPISCHCRFWILMIYADYLKYFTLGYY